MSIILTEYLTSENGSMIKNDSLKHVESMIINFFNVECVNVI